MLGVPTIRVIAHFAGQREQSPGCAPNAASAGEENLSLVPPSGQPVP
jgi:hypothetical protein